MKHRVYYDDGNGMAALLAAAIRVKHLRGDVLPSAEHVANYLRDHGRVRPPGNVNLLGEGQQERVYWCGLGKSSTVTVRTWRHFLHLYEQKQRDYSFYYVPRPKSRKWKRGERLYAKPGQQGRGQALLAEAAVREYAVFLTVLLTDWQEG